MIKLYNILSYEIFNFEGFQLPLVEVFNFINRNFHFIQFKSAINDSYAALMNIVISRLYKQKK